jgi:hypothetical protein
MFVLLKGKTFSLIEAWGETSHVLSLEINHPAMYPCSKKNVLIWLLLALLYCCGVPAGDPPPADDPYNGIRRSYRPDGSLLAEVTFRDSIRHGPARNYYPNGRVQLELTYEHGVRQGEAIRYYENGDVYQVTPFVDGKRHGIQRRFYENNLLMAEIPFENDVQVVGLKEYSRGGRLITSETRIVFSVIDRTAFHNQVDLMIELSDGDQQVSFSRQYYDADGQPDFIQILPAENGKVVETIFLPPGTFRKDVLHIVAERRTRLGNREVIKGSYTLDVENKKRFFD